MTVERILMALLVGGIAVGCVAVLYPFFSALLWAGILVYTTWPIAEWLRDKLKLRPMAMSGLMVGLTAVVIVLPIALAAPGGADDVAKLRHVIEDSLRAGLPDSPEWVFDIPLIGPTLGGLWNRWAEDVSVMLEALRPYFGIVLEGGLGLLLGIANGVLMFLLSLVVAFVFYANAEPMAAYLTAVLQRVAGPRADRLILVTGATMRGVVYGLLGTAIVQGILTALGLWITGVPRPLLLAGVAGLLSLLPVGSPLVWIPASLWLMGTGHLGWGIFLAIYGTFIISGSDSVIRPWFIARGAKLPFLLTVLGVLGGALAFGLLGIFLGPVLLGVGYTLAKEWAREQALPIPPEV